MSADAAAFVIVILVVLWAVLWWRIGAGTFRWDAYHKGFKAGKLEDTNDAYRRGLEAGLKVEVGSLKGKVVDPDRHYYV